MRRTGIGMILVVLATAAWAQEGTGPQLVEEQKVMQVGVNEEAEVVIQPLSMRLSPDGKRLLYIERRKVTVEQKDGTTRRQTNTCLMLRDVAGGEPVALPVLPLFDKDYAVSYVSTNPFSPDSKQIVVPAGLDVNGDGTLQIGEEPVQVGLYDIASGKLSLLSLTDNLVLPCFDGQGQRIVTLAMTMKGDGRLMVCPVAKDEFKPLAVWGLPRSPSPTAPLMPVVLPPDRKADNPRTHLLLYDLAADKTVTQVVTHPRNHNLDDLSPQWTPEGRYVFDVDLATSDPTDEAGEQRKILTRIYDVQEGTDAGTISDVICLGPGPYEGTMVVSKAEGEGDEMALLYNVVTEQYNGFGGENVYPICAQGKWLIYLHKAQDEPATIRVAKVHIRQR